jgi:hypothetical protein
VDQPRAAELSLYGVRADRLDDPDGPDRGCRPPQCKGNSRRHDSISARIPEELYALFGTGYLGYTAARTWGKVKGVER